jgi:hypothetical protein
VTSPIEVAQTEDEDEQATEQSSINAVAYRAHDEGLMPVAILGLLILAAFAGVSMPRRRRLGRRDAALAHATVRIDRQQGRYVERRRRW